MSRERAIARLPGLHPLLVGGGWGEAFAFYQIYDFAELVGGDFFFFREGRDDVAVRIAEIVADYLCQ